jgi:membrane-associated phospholipid phosphatase
VKISLANTDTPVVRYYIIVLSLLFIASLSIDKGLDILWINGHHTAFLDLFFKTITNLGDGLIFIPIVVFAAFVRFRYAIAALVASLLHGILVSVFKRALFPKLERPRKFIGDDLIHFVSGVDVHNFNSFPSGHTATAFCAAFFMALISGNKAIGVFTLMLAFMVGYSRIYLAQHFLIDVAAGAVVGTFSTYIVWQVMELNQLPVWMNRRLDIGMLLKRESFDFKIRRSR